MFAEKIYSLSLMADQAILIILFSASVFNLAVIVERFIYLRKFSQYSQVMRLKMQQILQKNAINEVESIAQEVHSLEGRAAEYSLAYYHKHGLKGLEEFINTFVLTEKPALERGLGFLATIGSNAPFVGLLGTVFGIMKAFRELASVADQGNNQVMIMSGISMALVATGAGLFVAIPAQIFYNFYSRKIKYILENLDALKEITLAYAQQKGQ